MTAITERSDAQTALTRPAKAAKPKRSRTDFTVCVCTDGKHAVVHHRTPPRPAKPTPTVVERFVGHVIEHTITWTNWKVSA